MEDDIIKHGKKIIKTAKEPKLKFWEKIKEISTEIIIIVFAVSVSIWLHSWNEHRKEQADVKEFLSDLKVDLNHDIKDLEEQNAYLERTSKSTAFYGNLTKEKTDSLEKIKEEERIKINLNPIFKIRNTGNYEGFRSSGKIGLIEDRKVKSAILDYYQTTVPAKEDWQNYYNSLVYKVADALIEDNDYNGQQIYAAIYTSGKVKGMLRNCSMQALMIINLNKQVIAGAKQIIAEIEKN